MTLPQDSSERSQKTKRTKQQHKAFQRTIMTFCVVVLVALVGFNVQGNLDKPRREAAVTKAVEANGGEVVKIVHRPSKATPGYVDVVFENQPSRCTLHLLDQNPPVFDCNPAVNR